MRLHLHATCGVQDLVLYYCWDSTADVNENIADTSMAVQREGKIDAEYARDLM